MRWIGDQHTLPHCAVPILVDLIGFGQFVNHVPILHTNVEIFLVVVNRDLVVRLRFDQSSGFEISFRQRNVFLGIFLEYEHLGRHDGDHESHDDHQNDPDRFDVYATLCHSTTCLKALFSGAFDSFKSYRSRTNPDSSFPRRLQ